MKQLIFLNGKKYDISGPGGNAFAILGAVQSLLRQCKVPREEIDALMEEARSDNYDHLLEVCAAATGIEFVNREETTEWLN